MFFDMYTGEIVELEDPNNRFDYYYLTSQWRPLFRLDGTYLGYSYNLPNGDIRYAKPGRGLRNLTYWELGGDMSGY